MRWVAKNAVAAGLADRLEVQVAYAIGKAAPVGFYVESFGTAHVSEETILNAIREVFDLRPAAIIRDLDLLRPICLRHPSRGCSSTLCSRSLTGSSITRFHRTFPRMPLLARG